MKFENRTPYAADHAVIQDHRGRDRLVVAVKATYSFDHDGPVTPAGEQVPVAILDEYEGDPEKSGLRYSSDITFGKTGTDIALAGHAVAPSGKTPKSYVVFKLGKVEKSLAIFGNRTWTSTLGMIRKTSPEPFDSLPLSWDRAFGGHDNSPKDEKHHSYDARNPIGTGYFAPKSKVPMAQMNLPNIEDPDNLIETPKSSPAPAGLGFMAPHWQPRLAYAGTYDETWQANRMPLLPEDFDPRFNQSAHPDLVYPGFVQGGEEVMIAGVSKKGPFTFHLPTLEASCEVSFREDAPVRLAMPVDKVFFDSDQQRMILVASASLDIHNRLYDVDSVLCETEKGIGILENMPPAAGFKKPGKRNSD